MLDVAGLACVRGDRRLFQHLSFRLAAGRLLHLHGPNGAGKTTLLRTLCGLSPAEEGAVNWNGRDIRELGETYRADLRYVGHLNALKDDLSALENLRIVAALEGAPATEVSVFTALKRVGLAAYADLPTKVLSQGQKRRAALSRLLLGRSKLWILDEPFNALDVNAVETVKGVLREHLDTGGMVVLTTHQDVGLAAERVEHVRLGA